MNITDKGVDFPADKMRGTYTVHHQTKTLKLRNRHFLPPFFQIALPFSFLFKQHLLITIKSKLKYSTLIHFLNPNF